MPRKKESGRPARPLPPRIDATPEQLAKAMFAMPSNHKWRYEQQEPEYWCARCERGVAYPEVLSETRLCKECAGAEKSALLLFSV